MGKTVPATEEEIPTAEKLDAKEKVDGKEKEQRKNGGKGLLGFLIKGRGRDKKKIRRKRRMEREREEAVMVGGLAPAPDDDMDDGERDVSPHDRGREVERQEGGRRRPRMPSLTESEGSSSG